jgi:hypothetical protein
MKERLDSKEAVGFLFVGENRSATAIAKGYTWDNAPREGVNSAKKLFAALRNAGIEPREHSFANAFDDNGNPQAIITDGKIVVAMGEKVQKELRKRGIDFIPIVHPAARGIWCKQEKYNELIFASLTGGARLTAGKNE